jgi:hypothetical protein
MVFLRNLNHSRRIVVRTQGAPAGRVIPPGATTAMAIDLTILADPHIQARLAQARVAVLDQGGWSPDLRQRRAAALDWPELIAQAERAEIDRLRQHQERHQRAATGINGKQLRTKDEGASVAASGRQWRNGPRWLTAFRPSVSRQPDEAERTYVYLR